MYENLIKNDSFSFKRKKITQSFRVYQFSDWHLDKKNNNLFNANTILNALKQIKEQTQADNLKNDQVLLFFTGDAVSCFWKPSLFSPFGKESDLSELKKALNGFKHMPYKKFCVMGNHDLMHSKAKQIQNQFKKAGFHLLGTKNGHNEHFLDSLNISITGTFPLLHKNEQNQRKKLEKKVFPVEKIQESMIKSRTKYVLNLVLTHNPDFFYTKQKIQEKIGDFMAFCGHTHGLQHNLPVFKTIARQQLQLKGHFVSGFCNNQKIYVHRGLQNSHNSPLKHRHGNKAKNQMWARFDFHKI